MKGLILKANPQQVTAANRGKAKLKEFSALGINTTTNNVKAVEQTDLVVIGVKPEIVPKVLAQVYDHIVPDRHLVISIAAGLTLSDLENQLPKGTKVARVMPNVNCLVGESVSAYCVNKHCTDCDCQHIEAVFSSVGQIHHIEEATMDCFTALCGSGPAIIANFIEALADGGVRAGLPRNLAIPMAAQAVLGTAQAVLHDQHPAQVKDMVCSPGGASIAGVHAAEEGGLRAATITGVFEAYKAIKGIADNSQK